MLRKFSNIFSDDVNDSFIDWVYNLEDIVSSKRRYTKKFEDYRILNPKVLYILLKIINFCEDLDEIVKWIKNINISGYNDSETSRGLFIRIILNGEKINKNVYKCLDKIHLHFDSENNLKKINIIINSDYIFYAKYPVKKDIEYVINGRAIIFTKKMENNFEIQNFYTVLYHRNILLDQKCDIFKNGIQYIFDKRVFCDIDF